jgi:hypothetical protein
MKIECNFWIGGVTGVMIECEEGQEPIVKQSGELTGPQHAASHFITELIRALSLGKSIDHLFNPYMTTMDILQKPEELVRCKWMKSGKLILLGTSDKRWKHAGTVEEVLESKRVFTCSRTIYDLTPKRRPGQKKKG